MIPIEIAVLLQITVVMYAARCVVRTDRRRPAEGKRRVVVHMAMIALAIAIFASSLDMTSAVPERATMQMWHTAAVVSAIGTGAALYYLTGSRW